MKISVQPIYLIIQVKVKSIFSYKCIYIYIYIQMLKAIKLSFDIFTTNMFFSASILMDHLRNFY